MRASREEWRRRIERWRDSGLTADQFAASAGINAGTLKFWKCVLSREAKLGGAAPARVAKAALVRCAPGTKASALMEVRATMVARDVRIELELPGGRHLWIPSGFDVESLRRLIDLLGEA
jgi:transposase